MNWNEFTQGVRRGTPVGMGYLSVSFGFGTLAVSQGMKVLDAVLISATSEWGRKSVSFPGCSSPS